jgi:iron(III) transport system ATP-binding protein
VLSQIGTPRDIYRSPLSRGVAEFIGEANFLPGTYEGINSRGLATVRAADGEWWGRVTDTAWRPQPGEKVLLCIRPESLRFVARAAGRNNLTGRISESIYLGELAQYHVSCHGCAIRMAELNPAALHESGGDCILSAEPEDVMILRA